MSVKNLSLMLPCVESQYTQEYIANVFYRQNIAKVSNITLIPYIKNTQIYSIAYISISEWCDSESAYNLIKRLNNTSKETRIIHNDDDWWSVHINTHNNGTMNVGDYTLSFNSEYFNRNYDADTISSIEVNDDYEFEDDDYEFEDDDEDEFEAEEHYKKLYNEKCLEFNRNFCVQGLSNDYYTADEAFEHISLLNNLLNSIEDIEPVPAKYYKILNELNHFENELRIYKSVNQSNNVTLRTHQVGFEMSE